MSHEAILVDKKDHVVTITLNRPDVLNAQNNAMRREGCHVSMPSSSSSDEMDDISKASHRIFGAVMR